MLMSPNKGKNIQQEAILVADSLGRQHALDFLQDIEARIASNPHQAVAAELKEILADNINKPIAVMCCRYCYRGVLKRVTSGCVVLSQAKAVEVTGPADGEMPVCENDLLGMLILPVANIEAFFWPTWAGYRLKREKSDE